MSISEWKQVESFNITKCKEFNQIKIIKKINSYYCNGAKKVFCDDNKVHVFSRNWKHCTLLVEAVKLCALARSQSDNSLIILTKSALNRIGFYLYDLDKFVKLFEVQLSIIGTPTTIETSNVGSQLFVAIGLDNGNLILNRAQTNRQLEVASNFRSFGVSKSPVIKACFKEKDSVSAYLYICSYDGIFCYVVTATNAFIGTKIVLDEFSTASWCSMRRALCVASENSPYLVAARDDAVYCYTPDGRGPCYAIEGNKKFIEWMGNSLVIVLEKAKPNTGNSSLLLVLDIDNKLILFSKEYNFEIVGLFVSNKECHIIIEHCELLTLTEADVHNKIAILIHKNLFDVALRLMATSTYQEEQVLLKNINLSFGDYLLSKGDLNGALEKYIAAVDVMEPYLIIRKLVAKRFIKLMMKYVAALDRTRSLKIEYAPLISNCEAHNNLCNELESLFKDTNIAQFLVLKLLGKNSKKVFYESINMRELLKHKTNKSETLNFLKNVQKDQQIVFLLNYGSTLLRYNSKISVDILELVQVYDRLLPLLLDQINHNPYCYIESYFQTNFKNCQEFYNLILKNMLRNMRKGQKTPEEILTFLEDNVNFMCPVTGLSLCQANSFWEGVIFFCKHGDFKSESNYHSILKNCSHSALNYTLKVNNWDTNLIIKNINTMQQQSKEQLLTLLNNILTTQSGDKEKSQLFQKAVITLSDYNYSQIREIRQFFTTATISQKSENHGGFKTRTLYLHKLKQLLSDFERKPLEFRRTLCDICLQQLSVPATHYLCQHSYHKECVQVYSKVTSKCVKCSNKAKQINNISNMSEESEGVSNIEIEPDMFRKLFNMSNGKPYEIFQKKRIYKAKLNASFCNQEKLKSLNTFPVGKSACLNPFKDENVTNNFSGNPFEMDYDSNLNPFEM